MLGCDPLNERLSWEEITRKYPNEFVAMIDPERNDRVSICGGTVVAHGESTHELLEYLKTLGVKNTACVWTGVVRASGRRSVR
jgi:hypothetical protein